MLAVVNQPHIEIRGDYIPEPLLLFVRSNYGTVSIEDEDDNKAVPFRETDLYEQVRGQMTPRENLFLLRENRGMTQWELADKSGYTDTEIAAMEKGIVPIAQEDAQKLADALGTSVSNLYF
jgi:DNA-binding XRE family transcriptional regulator